MRILPFILFLLPCVAAGGPATKLDSADRVVALTFDACQTRRPLKLDAGIVRFLTNNRIPFTVFLTGRFCPGNRESLVRLSELSYVEFENHSMNHSKFMTNMTRDQLAVEILSNSGLIGRMTGVTPKYFRFPYGYENPRVEAAAEAMGLRVIRWSFASGDPDPKLSAQAIRVWVLNETKPGSILIFHINGRGKHTAEILPEIVGVLKARGYRFVRLDEGMTE